MEKVMTVVSNITKKPVGLIVKDSKGFYRVKDSSGKTGKTFKDVSDVQTAARRVFGSHVSFE